MVKAMVLMVLWLTVCRSTCNEVEKGVENVKERLGEVAMVTWAEWAMIKVSTGLGLAHNDAKGCAHSALDKASEAASKTTSAMISTASESSKYISEKAGEAMDMVGDAKETTKDKATVTYNNVGDDVKVKAYNTYAYVVELAHQVLKKVQTMTGYAYDSISERVGKAMEIGSDTTQTAKETVDNKASDVYDATEKANQKIRMATDKCFEMKGNIGNKAKDAYNSAQDSMQSKDFKASGATTDSFEEAVSGYDSAKEKVDDSYKVAKDSMKEEDKERYEDAKEKASDASGNLGEAMRTQK